MKVTFLIPSLDYGGSERQLTALARGMFSGGHDVRVVVFRPGGPFEADLHADGVPVLSPGKHHRWDLAGFMVRLAMLLRRDRADVWYSFLGFSNCVATVLKPILPGVRLVWGVRASNMDLPLYDIPSRLPYWVERRLTRFPDLIISNSHAGKAHAITRGFPEKKMVVVPNGIDTEKFGPDSQSRLRVRAEWGIGEKEMLVGLIGRLDPIKDHRTFLSAAALLAKDHSNVRFVCVGGGADDYRREMTGLSENLGLSSKLLWSGSRADMPGVFSALDVACSSSAFGEGFPNVIGEAMACGIPCVVTDVGDSARIVADTGIVVPWGQAPALAEALGQMLERVAAGDSSAGERARSRILANFSMDALLTNTSNALRTLF